MSFDTSKLEELLDCLKKGAEAADAKALELAAAGESEDARKQLRRAGKRREWAAALEIGIKVLQKAPARRSPTPKILGPETPSFEAFWKAYPNKKAKGDAWKAWNQVAAEPIASDILSAIARAKNSQEWKKDNGEFIPHPATWLRRKCWLDEVNTPPGQAPKVQDDPEHWTEFLLAQGMSYERYQFAKSYVKSDFAKWRNVHA